ncbi:S8 family serine peptidase [Lysinibacillus piscis]|uniref:SLH domain-containing protein n=1 Tax=Lysinibacillus piscis TaxID=2518931 RepID=A0ABQ5NJ70_9BACI|nr:S8 family serine peptidase [Lysinibacillus sp. KH24]GLC88352.1 hypothetical protein LYSBPC_14790 [Lysinibacillus sp. KH24]
MKNKQFRRISAIFLVFVLFLSMLLPIHTSANSYGDHFKNNSLNEQAILAKAAIAEQLRVQNGPATLHRDLQGLTGDESVDVIIHLSEKPVALEKGITELTGRSFSMQTEQEVKEIVATQQEEVVQEMEDERISFSLGYTFDTVLNGLAAEVKAGDLEKLLQIDGITLIEPDVTVYASEEVTPIENGQVDAYMNTSNSFLGIEQLWQEGLEGQGVKVAVLDTGIDVDHPEFAGIYKGGKNFIPNSADYLKQRADDDASETSPKEKPANKPEFNERGSAYYTSHGTHVAGTIAAIGANPYGIKGIAPKVDLYMYRVLGAYGNGPTSGIVKGIETAVVEGMDVINLSLGGESNTEVDASSFAINNAVMAGVISVIATGNSGPKRGTMGTPSTAPLGIAVGNTTNPEKAYDAQVNVTVSNEQVNKQLNAMATTFGANLHEQLSGEFDLVAVPGIGAASDFENVDVEGKVALIARGSIAFVDKIANAKKNGAVAAIIHNFEGGTNAPGPSGTFLGDSFSFIPTFDMSVTDGVAIRDALKKGEGKVSFTHFGSVTSLGDEVNDSSSRGPSVPNFDIKPDVTAPGTNIMSTIPMYKKDFPNASYDQAYDRKTGTSMATPHIAGIAALIKQAHPDWSPFDVKVALSNTAQILDTTKYDVFSQGAGRVNAYAAVHPSALAYVQDTAVLDSGGEIVDNVKGTVTFGPQPIKEQAITVSKEIVVKDIKGVGGSYSVSVETLQPFGDAMVTVDKPSFVLNGQELLTVTLTASKNEAAQFGDELFGYIHITPTEPVTTDVSLTVDRTALNLKSGDAVQLDVIEKTTQTQRYYTEISLPFAADFGGVAPTQIKNMAITSTDLSFNQDGINDSADLTFTLTGEVNTNYIELWDVMNPQGGQYEDGYIGYLHAGSSLAAGQWKLPITGTYTPWGGSAKAKIPDGLYTVDFSASVASGGTIKDYVGPIVVKSTTPDIAGVVQVTSGDSAGVVSGQITDKYIDYNEELKKYGLAYPINTKLHASYEILRAGTVVEEQDFVLNEDGSYEFAIAGFNSTTDTMKVIVRDAAGNRGESILFEPIGSAPVQTEEPAAPINEETLPTAKAKFLQANVSEGMPWTYTDSFVEDTTANSLTLVSPIYYDNPYAMNKQDIVHNAEGMSRPSIFESPTVTNVTKQATYVVEDSRVATVTEGLVYAKSPGTTKIIVQHGNNEVEVTVNVTASPVNPTPTQPNPSPDIDWDRIDSKPVIPSPVNPTISNPNPSKPEPVKPEPSKEQPEKSNPKIMFTDIPKTHWAASYIQQAVEQGLLKGYPDGTFKPNSDMTRAQFASVLVRALGLDLTDTTTPFRDIDHYAVETQNEIAAAFRSGIIKGSNGQFNPSAAITRTQMALMIARAYMYQTQQAYTPTQIAPFSDIKQYDAETIQAISLLHELTIITGSEGKFMPENATTRAQGAKIFVNLLQVLGE